MPNERCEMTLPAPETLQRPFRLTLWWTLVTLVAALMALMTVQVVLRYGFNASLLWAEELCRYMLIWMAFLGVVFAYERGEIAAIGFVASVLPRVPALLLTIFGLCCSILLCALLGWYGWIYAVRAGSSQIPAIGFILEGLFGDAAPPTPGRFWVYVALPAGMALLGLRLLGDTALYVRALAGGASVAQVLDRNTTGPSE
jgi:TRAP-type C4-dicarboxylate transport system permease small subunit